MGRKIEAHNKPKKAGIAKKKLLNFKPTKVYNTRFTTPCIGRRTKRGKKDADCVLLVNDCKFYVHKQVLARGSPFFAKLLQSQFRERNSSELWLDYDIEAAIFKLVINYFYTGKIEITTDNLKDIFILAGYLLIDELKEFCLKIFKAEFCCEIIADVRDFAIQYCLYELLHAADQFLQRNIELCIKSNEFLHWRYDMVEDIFASDVLEVSTEMKLYEAVMRWLRYSARERVCHMNKLLGKVRFDYLTLTDYVQIVNNDTDANYCARLVRRLQSPPRGYYKGIYFLNRTATTFYRYRPQYNCVQALSVPNKSRKDGSLIVCGDKIYLLGGEVDRVPTASVEVYDPAENRWTSLTPMLQPRYQPVCCTFEGRIYVFCGGGNEVYCPTTGCWSVIPNSQHHTVLIAVAVDDSIYLFDNRVMHQYKPNTSKWSKKSLSAFDEISSIVSYGSRLLIFSTYSSVFWLFDPTTDSTPRLRHFSKDTYLLGKDYKAVRFHDSIYLICGSGFKWRKGLHHCDVLKLDPRVLLQTLKQIPNQQMVLSRSVMVSNADGRGEVIVL